MERVLLSNKLLLSFGVVTALSTPVYANDFYNKSINNAPPSKTIITISLEGSKIADNAKSFVEKLAEDGIGFLENQSLNEEQRKKEFQKVLKHNFDMKTIGRFALGRYWRTSSKQQQKEYLDLFEKMVVDVYSRRFSDYNGEDFVVVSSRVQGKSDAIVLSQIVPSSGSKINVEWRVRKKKNGSLKVVDIMVEGVSMSLTQRSDFASVIQRGGGKIDVLLDHLRSN